MRIFLCEKDGQTLNAIVVSALGDSGIYLLGATSEEGLKPRGAYLLQWRALQWLKERGCRWYDLGGINPETNPGVFHFKSGLGGKDVRQLPALELSGNWMSTFCVRAAENGRSLVHKLKSRNSPSAE
jgi:lipid II:glycine glycyltransferase (peptidoglycan interpeptide bridge formation enzyme)